MSHNGPGQLIPVSPPRFTSERYVNLLQTQFLPGLAAAFPDHENTVFVQDNSPVHSAAIVREWFQNHPEIQVLAWPARSPDLNPIENLWGHMVKDWNDVNYNGVRERTIEGLTEHVNQTWNSFPQDLTQRLVNSLPNRLAECIASNGYYTKY